MKNLNQIQVLAIVSALTLGCGTGGNKTTSHTENKLVILAFDYSASTEGLRRHFMDQSLTFATELDEDSDSFIMIRFASKVEEIYSGVPDDEDAFALELKTAVKGSDKNKGTNYPKLMEAIAQKSAQFPNKSVSVIVVGDGLNDFCGDTKLDHLYKVQAQKLLKLQNVASIRFWGVSTGAREDIYRAFGGANSKLTLASKDQAL